MPLRLRRKGLFPRQASALAVLHEQHFPLSANEDQVRIRIGIQSHNSIWNEKVKWNG